MSNDRVGYSSGGFGSLPSSSADLCRDTSAGKYRTNISTSVKTYGPPIRQRATDRSINHSAMVDRGMPSTPPARREEAVAHVQWLCCRPYCDRAPHSHTRECCGTL